MLPIEDRSISLGYLTFITSKECASAIPIYALTISRLVVLQAPRGYAPERPF